MCFKIVGLSLNDSYLVIFFVFRICLLWALFPLLVGLLCLGCELVSFVLIIC